MKRVHDMLVPVALLASAWLGLGCQAPSTPPAGDLVMDRCADRLHDFCGQLLLFYAVHRQLPQRLDELNKDTTAPALPPACPVSGKPYVYDPNGLQVADRPGRLILFDAEPCHGGMRWGVLVEEPPAGQLLIVRVVRLPESAFSGLGPERKSRPSGKSK